MSGALELQLAEAEVAGLQAEADGWQLRLSTAWVRPGPDAPEGGWARPLLLRLQQVQRLAPDDGRPRPLGDGDWLGRLREARLGRPAAAAGGWQWQACLPLPGRLAGPLRLELDFAHGSVLHLHLAGLACDWAGEAGLRPAWQC